MEKNFVFIDTQNINLSIQDQGWKLDWKKFNKYLQKKYKAVKIYLFIGYVPENQSMYTFFQNCGYTLIFKPVLELNNGQTKGNIDAELVLQAMIDYKKYDKAVIITGDGDFACLVKYFYKKNKLLMLIVPNERKYSIFLRKTAKEKIDSLTNLRTKLEYKKKVAPTKQ
ncbi:MAG TPA: NYN domain-containing protein [Candidatus Absconditabacterales bacterium]|nr:NYN domain-containing protein [Candidatus Absconditabacterales bacterium]HOQ79301.1 NYN domain-containing protein [Candidatus Absconditabacterales bacterium]HPK28329.1 NYN domain-containing protein [Candidatus Absconditabacterales bacterium]